MLVMSSTDGYVSFVTFALTELGTPLNAQLGTQPQAFSAIAQVSDAASQHCRRRTCRRRRRPPR
jgi:hypothetical protein